jgi:hypothetical protein
MNEKMLRCGRWRWKEHYNVDQRVAAEVKVTL